MADQLHFELVTPERLLRSDDVYMVVVPASEGDMGVLAGHAPVMTTIRPGAIAIYASDGAAPERVFIDGGMAQIDDKGLTILAEGATPVGEIDAAALTQQLADARDDIRLAKSEVETDMAERRVARLEAMQEALAA